MAISGLSLVLITPSGGSSHEQPKPARNRILYWPGAPANAPPVNIWRLVPHGNSLLASDMNFGLNIDLYN
jgi:hypothetical protein